MKHKTLRYRALIAYRDPLAFEDDAFEVFESSDLGLEALLRDGGDLATSIIEHLRHGDDGERALPATRWLH